MAPISQEEGWEQRRLFGAEDGGRRGLRTLVSLECPIDGLGILPIFPVFFFFFGSYLKDRSRIRFFFLSLSRLFYLMECTPRFFLKSQKLFSFFIYSRMK